MTHAARPSSLPWHDDLWHSMSRALADDRVAHGILICGAKGVGKRRFAHRLVNALLCIQREPNGDACGHCPRCRQRSAGTHPDISRLVPEESGRMIKVEQVRNFGHRLHLTPQYDSGRVGWVEPAEQLSISAANSLLKTLEEPPAGCHIVLITDRVSALMATIRSRCQLWRVPSAAPDIGRVWLSSQLADSESRTDEANAAVSISDDLARTPLTVIARQAAGYDARVAEWDKDLARLLARRANPVTVAERAASKDTAAVWMDWLYRRAQQLLQASLTTSPEAVAIDPATSAPTQAVTSMMHSAAQLGADVLEPWCRHVIRAARLQQSNADWRLVIESLLIDLSQRIAAKARR